MKSDQDVAEQAIEHSEALHLSREDQQRFAEALFSPPAPALALALERAFAHRARLLQPG